MKNGGSTILDFVGICGNSLVARIAFELDVTDCQTLMGRLKVC